MESAALALALARQSAESREQEEEEEAEGAVQSGMNFSFPAHRHAKLPPPLPLSPSPKPQKFPECNCTMHQFGLCRGLPKAPILYCATVEEEAKEPQIASVACAADEVRLGSEDGIPEFIEPFQW